MRVWEKRWGRRVGVVASAVISTACTSDSRTMSRDGGFMSSKGGTVSAARDGSTSGGTDMSAAGGASGDHPGGPSSGGGDTSRGGRASDSGGTSSGGGSRGGRAADTGGTSSGGVATATGGVAGATGGMIGAGGGDPTVFHHADAGRDNWCYLPDPANHDRDRAIPYAVGTSLHTCLRGSTARDYYALTAPPDSAGGVVVLRVTNVGGLELSLQVYIGMATWVLVRADATLPGERPALWFAAAPSAKYVIVVEGSGSGVGGYTLESTYTAVVDPYEPNNTQGNPAPIALGKPISAMMFEGNTSPQASNPYWDFYKITLGPGPATVSVSNAPLDVPLIVSFSQPNVIDDQFYKTGTTNGSGLSFTTDPLPAGDYQVLVWPDREPDGFGKTETPASYATSPYTLVVTQ
jgi:hypothetical protein